MGTDVVQPRARPRCAAGGVRRTAVAESVFGVGIVVFAGASLACGFAPDRSSVLVAARAVQGVAGAAIVCAALDLLSDAAGADAPAARIWAIAGVLGAALGPAVGGILTQLLGWESIFFVQAPVMLLALARADRPPGDADARAGGASARRGKRCAAPRLGRARGRAVPARDPADQRLAARAVGGGARRHGHAASRRSSRPASRDGSSRSGPERPRGRSSSRAGSPRSAGCRTPAPSGRSCRRSRSAPGSGSRSRR